jgi:TPP-dependent indolepyruvate ferredoxin oxidoreductase alpha subunit
MQGGERLPQILEERARARDLAGFALSRFAGLWVGMKTIAEVIESAGAFDLPDSYPPSSRPPNS